MTTQRPFWAPPPRDWPFVVLSVAGGLGLLIVVAGVVLLGYNLHAAHVCDSTLGVLAQGSDARFGHNCDDVARRVFFGWAAVVGGAVIAVGGLVVAGLGYGTDPARKPLR